MKDYEYVSDYLIIGFKCDIIYDYLVRVFFLNMICFFCSLL